MSNVGHRLIARRSPPRWWRVVREGLQWQPLRDSSRLVARRGPGPGELIAPLAIGALDDTVLVVYDVARAKRVEFTPAGMRAEQTVIPPIELRAATVRQGRVLAYVTPAAASLDETVVSAIIAFDATREAWSDTLARFTDEASSLVGSADLHRARLPWESRVHWDLCADGSVLVVRSDRWAVARVRGRDTVQQVVRGGAVSTPFDAAMLAEYLAAWEAGPLRRQPEAMRASALEEARQRQVTHAPLIDAVRCGEANQIVVAEAMRPADTMQTWVRVSADGREHTRVALPPALLPQMVGDVLVGLLDEGAGERLVRASIGR
ncbi:MAG: hypothetical protein MUD17_13885 [Gemmatimonadaceae bacterium]|nr:hypothetical protein [Gemmatimonadaceae bacterium]